MADIEKSEANGFYKLSWLQRIGYGVGDMAQNFIFQTIMGYINFYYTDVYIIHSKESATKYAAAILTAGSIADVIWDPIVGAIVDKSNPRFGKYRSWLLYGGIPLTIASILSFWDVAKPSVLYAIVTFTVMKLTYTLVNVPYGALNASLTRDTHEITVLTSVRMVCANTAGFLTGAGILILVALFSHRPIPWVVVGFKLLGSLPGMIVMNFVPAIKKVVGKKRVFYLALLIAIIGYGLIYFVSHIGIKKYVILLYIAQFIKSCGVCIATGYMWALVPEVISYAEYKTGRRIAGIVNALTGIFFKAGMTLGNAFPNIVLSVVDYVQPAAEEGGSDLPTDSKSWFYTMSIFIIVGFVLLIFCFTQTKERVVMDESETKNVKVSDLWVEFVRNRPLRVIALYFITAFAFMFIGNASENYLLNNLESQTTFAREGIRWSACVFPSLVALLAMFIISRYELTDEKIEEINLEIEKRNHKNDGELA